MFNNATSGFTPAILDPERIYFGATPPNVSNVFLREFDDTMRPVTDAEIRLIKLLFPKLGKRVDWAIRHFERNKGQFGPITEPCPW